MKPASALRDVPIEDLKRLLASSYAGHLTYPLKLSDLMLMGMNRLADHGGVLQGLNERGVRAVLVAVIAERNRFKR